MAFAGAEFIPREPRSRLCSILDLPAPREKVGCLWVYGSGDLNSARTCLKLEPSTADELECEFAYKDSHMMFSAFTMLQQCYCLGRNLCLAGLAPELNCAILSRYQLRRQVDSC